MRRLFRTPFLHTKFMKLSIGLAALLLSAAGAARAVPTPPPPPPQPWPQFHHDEQHTGVAEGTSNIFRGIGPQLRWQYRVTAPPVVAEFTDPSPPGVRYRWTSTLPLADLDGDGKLEVIVTTPDGHLKARGSLKPTIKMRSLFCGTPKLSAFKTLH